MFELFPYYLCLVVAIVLLTMLANRIKVAYPILLLLAGLAISFVPNLPTLRVDPELIFVIFLPPLLYQAAWAISWKALWKWRRTIASFAFLVAFLTSVAVAWVSSRYIPGFTLALGFLLGGIVSSPDAVSAEAILKFVRLPKRMAYILQGESLLNDASSLLILRFALLAVGTGQFVLTDVTLGFGWIIIGGIGTGLGVALIFFKLHKLLPNTTDTDLVFTLVTPYFMYIIAESINSSGVLSVVSGGLFLAQRRHLFLNSASRLRAANVWDSLRFILDGLVFMLIGLDLPEVMAGLGQGNIPAAIGYGLLITLVLIVVRLLSAFGAVLTTLIARNFITVADARYPGMKAPFILGWAGMRGVISLAAALSIPVQLSDGVAFPQRNLILFVTFIVILSTLLIQGLTLPYLIRKFDLPDADNYPPEEEDYHRMRSKLAEKSLIYLKAQYAVESQPSAFRQLIQQWEANNELLGDDVLTAEHKEVYSRLLDQQRQWLREWNTNPATNEEVIRRHLVRLDLNEERIGYL